MIKENDNCRCDKREYIALVYVYTTLIKFRRLYVADIRERAACGYLKQKLRNTAAATP